MTAKPERIAENSPDVMFKCPFCGETKPLKELVVMRHYYPQVPACRDCARGTPKSSAVEEVPPAEEKTPVAE